MLDVRRRIGIRSATGIVATLAMLAAYGAVAAPPAAAGPATKSAIGLVDWLHYVGGLAGTGPFGQNLTGTTLAVGGPDGLDLKGLTDQAVSVVGAAADSTGALVSKLNSLNGNQGGWSFTTSATDASSGGVHRINVTMGVTKSVDTGLELHDPSDDAAVPPFDLSSAHGLKADLGMTATFTLADDDTNFWIERSSTSPSLGVHVGASIPPSSVIKSGLGIIGVSVSASTFQLMGDLTTAFGDPNADGKLAFTEPGGAPGELAATGSAGGVAVPTIAPGGSLSGSLTLAGETSTAFPGLPSVNATVGISSTNLASGKVTATFDSNAFDAIKPFQTMTTRDLATALAQMAATLGSAAHSQDLPLPLLRGNVSDALRSSESLVAFLKDFVKQPPSATETDPAKFAGIGNPQFTSIQDLAEKLSSYVDSTGSDATGAAISLVPGGQTYDTSVAGHPKLRLTLKLSHHATTTVPLDIAGTDLTGTADFEPTYLIDSSKTFGVDVANRQITAGGTTALISSVDPGNNHKLLLSNTPYTNLTPQPANLWKSGVTPTDGTSYSIAGNDPRTGQVEMANALKAGSGLVNVNASVPQATIKPSYDVVLPLVFDLQAPTIANPPVTVNNPDGTASVVTSTPTIAQRIMLHTGGDLITADLPIDTKVEAVAKVGFLDVKVGGDLSLCVDDPGVAADCTGTAARHFFRLSTKAVGDSQGDISLPDIFTKLRTDPTTLLNAPEVHGRAAGTLKLTVPSADDFFGTGPASVSLTWSDITDPSTLQLNAPDLSKLLAFDISGLDDPTKLYGALLKALEQLDLSLHGTEADGALGKRIPLLGKSVRDLLGGVEQGSKGAVYTTTTLKDDNRDFKPLVGRRLLVGSSMAVITKASDDGKTATFGPAFETAPTNDTPYALGDELLATIDELTAQPAPSLNTLTDVLNKHLGDKKASFTVVPAAGSTPAQLKLSIDWTRTVPIKAPLKFDLSVPNVPSTIAGTAGTGTLDVTVTGAVKVGLLFPLSAAAVADPLSNLKIAGGSTASVGATIDSTNATLAANLGPLALSVGDPSAATPGTDIHGKLKLSLTGGSGDQTLGDFFKTLSLTSDPAGSTVTCTGISTPNLALCANLPLFYKTGGTWTALGSGVTLALPRDADYSNLASYVTLPDGTTIVNALASQLIDLSALGDGLAGYLALLNNALQLADAAGKIPVVGSDIQQGLEFINSIKTAIQSVIPVDANDGSQQLHDESELQSKLDAIAASLPGTPSFKIAAECNAHLDQVGNLHNDGSHQGDTSTTYSYRVVAIRSGNTTGDARPSASLDLKNKAALTATDFNQFSWDESTWATGYRVERLVSGTWKVVATLGKVTTYKDANGATGATAPASAASDPILAPCPGAAITGFKIKVVIGQGDPGASGCTTDCVTAATRPLDLGLPGLSLSSKDPDHPNDLSNPDNGISAKVGWKLHLSFGLSKDKGFVVYTQDNDSDPHSPTNADSTPELVIGAAITAPKQFNGRLAFLAVQAKDATDADSTDRSFTGAFSVDLHQAGAANACGLSGCAVSTTKFLTLDDILSADLGQLVTAKIQAALHLKYRVTVLADEALPGIRADFHLDWGWDPSAGASPDDTGALKLGFDDVRINPGTFLKAVLGPVLDKINALYGPIKPVLDTISAPLPVLSDLSHLAGGGDVSILTLAAAFADGAGDPGTFAKFVEIFKSIKAVLDVVNAVSAGCTGAADTNDYQDDGNFCIHLGSFGQDAGKTFSTAATPDSADSLITAPESGAPAAAGAFFDQIKAKTGLDLAATDKPAASSGSKNACGAAADDRGFTFTALKNPSSLFGILLGKDVELACFDSGPLTLGFTMSESFGPVYAPPPVLIVISGSASVTAHIVAGFDTYGIRKAVQDKDAGVLARGVDFLDSLYFKTTDADGKPIPVLQFHGELAAGAEVSAVIIKVGVVGGIGLTVSFYWNDPNNDGKFRFSEFLATALNNPICLFNVGGELDLFLKVYVTLGFSPFSVSFDFTLVNIKLLDFSLKPDCTPPPPILGAVVGGTLYLHAGHLGTPGLRGNAAYDNHNSDKEKVVVRQHKDDAHAVTVQMLGITQDFTGVDRVVLDGTNYDGPIQALFQGAGDANPTPPPGTANSPFTLDTIVQGGNKDDVIKTGSGKGWIDGGGGNDQIVTGDRPDLDQAGSPQIVSGGDGADSISVGNADDKVYGDASLTFGPAAYGPGSISLTGFAEPTDPESGAAPGNDRISLGLGKDEAWGGGGEDTVGVAADSPLAAAHPGDAAYTSKGVRLHGGADSDNLSGGSGDDVIFTGGTFDPTGMTDDAIADRDGALDAGVKNTVDTGAGKDVVYGDQGNDFVTGHSAGSLFDTFYGGPGQDVLMGGYGQDRIFGGKDDDYLVAEPATVGEIGSANDAFGSARSVVHTPTDTAAQEKLLVGGGGTDRIFGGDGNAKIYGDHRDFTCSTGRTATDPSSTPPSESGVITGQGGNDDAKDVIFGGEGVDDINAGGGDDVVQARGNADYLCGSAGKDNLDAGNGDDKSWGGSGDDTTFGGNGDDHLYGNDGVDTTYGSFGTDVLEGNNDHDVLSGGAGPDTIVGGTRAIGADDTDLAHVGDYLYGEGGNDLLIGDNGVADPADNLTGQRVGIAYDLADGPASTHGDGDHLFGGDGDDSGYGGLFNDTLRGGADSDHLEGNPGTDTAFGETGTDDLIGGSSQTVSGSGDTVVGYPDAGDNLDGGPADDVVLGDNGSITRVASVDAGDEVGRSRGMTLGRVVNPYDRVLSPTAGTSGNDTVFGGSETDLLYGQGGTDTMHGDLGETAGLAGFDYLEGGPAADNLFGDGGEDDLVGGSRFKTSGTGDYGRVGQPDAGDVIDGGDAGDVAIGDNGTIDRIGTSSAITRGRGIAERRIFLFDLGDSSPATFAGNDLVLGRQGTDVLLGQGGADVLQGSVGDDYAEGGPGADLVEGNDGDDDLVGGSSTTLNGAAAPVGQVDTGDLVYGGSGDDLALGDNGLVTRVGTPDPRTFRVGSLGAIETRRALTVYDLGDGSVPPAGSRPVAGDDQVSGGSGVDLLLGQDGSDVLTGNSGDDYAEGNGGDDFLYGDRTLGSALVDVGRAIITPGRLDRTDEPNADDLGAQQDDLVGGSTIPGFRDGKDVVHGDGGADYELGDNGQVVRDIVQGAGSQTILTEVQTTGLSNLTNRIYAKRYAAGATTGAFVRHGVSPTTPTRFCASSPTCEIARAFGNDTLFGDAGDDTAYGQDGNDTLWGNDGDDDLYGELGDDTIDGGNGDDAILGDRGGIVDVYQDGTKATFYDGSQVPKVTYRGLTAGSVTRQVDLQHDVNGDAFIGASGSAAMPHRGDLEGGNDRIRGRAGHDSIHAGFGDDLANGDSGGDILFGDDGADVVWGGKGSDDPANPNDRGAGDSLVDYIFGGKGGDPGATKKSTLGSDVVDWRPRGTYSATVQGPGTCSPDPIPLDYAGGTKKASLTVDPCSWFEMTDMTTSNTTLYQHHQGIDWVYGGWDRDVMQGDVADNGPNPGDRLLDWNGAYNLYSHCNSAYGGYNDVRQHSPDWQAFLQMWSYTTGAGQGSSDTATSGTSAFDELALVYPGTDNDHGSGSAYPSTPGHFDDPNACNGS